MKTFIHFLMSFLIFNTVLTNIAGAETLTIKTQTQSENITYTQNEENRITVSVLNDEGSPVAGLTKDDFTITEGQKKIKILSFDPLHLDLDIPLNIAIVIDNSLSMKNRNAIEPLLGALDELLKIIRPIDHVTGITFSKKANTFFGRKLNLRTIKTNDISILKTFFEEGFSKQLTTRTYLYDAVSTGMDLLRQVPESEHNILAIFTDGTDNNSTAKKEELLQKASEIDNFELYTIDYLPENEKDEFFTGMTREYNGNIWKAAETSELIPIFKKLSKLLLHKYVITYRYFFPPKAKVSLNPDILNFDTLVMSGGKALGNKIFFNNGKETLPSLYTQFEDDSMISEFDPVSITDIKERYYHLLNLTGKWMTDYPELSIQLTGYISSNEYTKNLTELSRKRTEVIKNYLTGVWKIQKDRILTEALMVPENPEDEMRQGGIIENQRVEISYISDSLETTEKYSLRNSFNNFAVNTVFESEYGIKTWALELRNNKEILLTKSGLGTIDKSLLIPQNAIQDEILKSSEQITAEIILTDNLGNKLKATSLPCSITYNRFFVTADIAARPEGTLYIEPDEINIEEVTTIDTSPMLNFIYFSENSSDLSSKYIQFRNSDEKKSFKVESLRGSDEKYYQILNIIGRRMEENNDAEITLTGCNSNFALEENNLELSYSRAFEVKSYLKYIWGIDASRIHIKKQNLPDKASTSRNNEGRSENQRVEIISDHPEILKTVISTYIETFSNTHTLTISPRILSDYAIDTWEITLRGDGVIIGNITGEDNISNRYDFDLNSSGLGKVESYDNLTAELVLTDRMDNKLTSSPVTTPIKHLKREEMIALAIGQKITEKYALILFDFNQSTMGEKNKAILNQIVKRINLLPEATVKITGYTDTIGKREYNLALSKKRANSVYKSIMKDKTINKERISVHGNGPDNTFYDNTQPEGRALNRTVIIQLEYEKKQ